MNKKIKKQKSIKPFSEEKNIYKHFIATTLLFAGKKRLAWKLLIQAINAIRFAKVFCGSTLGIKLFAKEIGESFLINDRTSKMAQNAEQKNLRLHTFLLKSWKPPWWN